MFGAFFILIILRLYFIESAFFNSLKYQFDNSIDFAIVNYQISILLIIFAIAKKLFNTPRPLILRKSINKSAAE